MCSSKSNACFHCGLELPVVGTVRLEVASKEESFCCSGCAQVCKIIHETGLSSFYDNAPDKRSWATPEQAPKDAIIFDHIEIQADFVRQRVDGLYQARLLIEGIHCPACIWLIERTLEQIPAVKHCEVNFTRHCLTLRWQPDEMKLSEVILALGRIGYQAVPYQDDVEQKNNKEQRQDLMFRMAFAGFVFANVMTAAVCLYAGDFFGIEDRFRAVFQWYSMVLTFASIVYSGRSFFVSAWRVLKQRRLNMDIPIVLGICASFTWSSWVTLLPYQTAVQHVYFDSVSMFIFLILVGRFLESSAREIAGSATRHLLGLLPRSALRIEENQDETIIPLRSVCKNDVLSIKPGERIPVDGDVIFGDSDVDEAMVSGESRPMSKTVGDQVIGGTLNLSGHMYVRATHIGHQSVLSQIVELVEQAQTSKVKIQRLADRIVPWFVAAVLVLATITLAFWWWNTGIAFAVMAAVTVLIITCPCALGMATPMAIAIGAGLGGKLGVLIKKSSSLEQLIDVNHFVFDKTGTLTEGKLEVQHAQALIDESCLWSIVRTLENSSEHVLAQAIVKHLKDYPLLEHVAEFSNVAGRGVQATVHNKTWYIGSIGWMEAHHVQADEVTQEAMQAQEMKGHTIVVIFDGQHVLGWLALGDQLRTEAQSVIQSLLAAGKGVSILTGDRRTAAEAIVSQLVAGHESQQNIQVIAEVLPADKAHEIKQMQQQGLNVAMVGDGVNDAPALTQAHVGIAMGQATDVSAQAADMVLLGGLSHVHVAIRLSEQTMRTIKQNLGVSLGYNVLAVPLAMAGMIHPLFAAIAMPASSLLVIGNALWIRRRMAQ